MDGAGDRPLCAHRPGPGRPQRKRRRERPTDHRKQPQRFYLLHHIIILGWGVVQVGMSIQSHDASQRTQGFLCLFGGLMIAFAKEILTAIGVV